MKLSDIMGNAGLSMYAEVALVIFLLVFIAVTIRLWMPGTQQAMRDVAMLPLNDDPSSAAKPHQE